MAKVKVLILGYATTLKKGWIASSTTTLVQDGKIKIITDPGTNRRKLLNALKREGLEPEDIEFVFLTHYHLDHNILSGIFPKAKVLDDELVYDKDWEYEHGGKVPGTGLRIIPTPGHEKFHGSLVVPTERGIVVVAGDLWWWKTSQKQKIDMDSLLKLKDIYVKDKRALLRSRKKVLKIADWIIPGHGKMFKNPTKKV